MAKWIAQTKDPRGFERDSLLHLHESMRVQRNAHQSVIFEKLQYYVTLISALLGFTITLVAFGLPHIAGLENVRALTVILFGVCIIAVPAACCFIVGCALNSIKKEYQKLAEYLTVEQKIESALGLDRPITTQFDLNQDAQIFPDDNCLLFTRWVESRKARTATEFVDTLLSSRKGLYIPLARTLHILQGLNFIVFFAVLVILITTVVSMS